MTGEVAGDRVRRPGVRGTMFGNRTLKRKLKRLATDGVDEEVLAALITGDSKDKSDVANALWGASDTLQSDDRARVIPALEVASEDGHAEVRGNAIAALLNLGAPRGVERAHAALGDVDWFVRTIAAAELGHHGDASSGPHVVPLLTDPEAFVRAQAAGAMMNLGYVEAVPALEEMLKVETDPDAKRAAEEALAVLRT